MDAARAIENLLYSYAERIDAGDFAGVGELFRHGCIVPTPDAEHALTGAAEVRAMYDGVVKLYPDGTPRTRHVITNAIIDIAADGATATARSSYTVMQQTDELSLQPIISGRYEDRFHIVDDGWCFHTRTMFVDLVGDISHHLTMEL